MKRWNKRVRKTIDILHALLFYDRLFIGGGNSVHIEGELPDTITLVSNDAGIEGGAALWRDSTGGSKASPPLTLPLDGERGAWQFHPIGFRSSLKQDDREAARRRQARRRRGCRRAGARRHGARARQRQTALLLVAALATRMRTEKLRITGVPTSHRTAAEAVRLGIPLRRPHGRDADRPRHRRRR